MTMNDQLEALMETLKQLRDSTYPAITDSLLETIVTAHVEDPDGTSVHRRIQRALEELIAEENHAADRTPRSGGLRALQGPPGVGAARRSGCGHRLRREHAWED